MGLSQRAGKRPDETRSDATRWATFCMGLMSGLRNIYSRLRLKVNEAKSAVAIVFGRKFLGFRFGETPGGEVKRMIAPQAKDDFKHRIRQVTGRNRGRSMEEVVEALRRYMPGWKGYFRLSQMQESPAKSRKSTIEETVSSELNQCDAKLADINFATFCRGLMQGDFTDLDRWLRHRLRALHLKHWGRGTTTYRALRAMGVEHGQAAKVAMFTRRWWRNSQLNLNRILTVAYFDRLGVPRLF